MFILEGGKNHLGKKTEAKKILNFFLKSSIDKITFMCQSQAWYERKYKEGNNFKLPKKFYLKALSLSHRKNKKVGLSVCDLKSFHNLDDIKFDFYKLLSIAINNEHLIRHLIKKNKTIYISTGFNSSLKKIKKCLKILKKFKKKILLHTPMVARYDQLDFNKINYLKKRFNIHVGYSNHFFDMNTLSALSAYKPKVIMLYVKPTRKSNFIYPDHQHAVYLEEVEEIKLNYENMVECHP